MNWAQTVLAITQMVPVWVQMIEALTALFKKQNPAATVTGADKKAAATQAIVTAAGLPAEAHAVIGQAVDAQVALNNANGTFTHGN